MKIGFSFAGVSPRRYPQVAAKADELGFESCWMGEHLVWPAVMPPTYPYSQDGYPGGGVQVTTQLYDPWVTLATIAPVTKRLNLGTNVYILPLRNPFVTARAVVTLDLVSSGRAILGCGVGWLKEEFDIVGENPRNRGARTDEIVQILKKLWSEETIEFHGKYYDFGPVKFEPKPVQKPHPPILFGGDSEATLRRAAQVGDGWIAIGRGAGEALKDRVQKLHSYRRDCGREKEPFDITVNGGPGPTVDSIRRLEEAGATRVQVVPWSRPAQGRLNLEQAMHEMEEFANRVLAKLS